GQPYEIRDETSISRSSNVIKDLGVKVLEDLDPS
ncbi:hypothetical protein A2U01_0082962, partial [Trifolium medium]|nr:hypothetical protein [Trifolium medium]